MKNYLIDIHNLENDNRILKENMDIIYNNITWLLDYLKKHNDPKNDSYLELCYIIDKLSSIRKYTI
jgi:hypothetical protein